MEKKMVFEKADVTKLAVGDSTDEKTRCGSTQKKFMSSTQSFRLGDIECRSKIESIYRFSMSVLLQEDQSMIFRIRHHLNRDCLNRPDPPKGTSETDPVILYLSRY
jgi:hypothetical protein